ncbi:hypothetical protein [Algoriphagus sp. Y33]|uniref:hypothetical protein n=1 Tax=Algoriphagus sp. Y33 TaxID=2772483 RepID=UPI001780CCC9|nr:hypothetical protein [Algoriphagus sp. Y33]
MNLNYISIGLDYYFYIENQNEIRYEFQKRANFINDYFSKEVRRLKFKTDGTFNMISIELSESTLKPCSIVPNNTLKVELFFDRSRYEKIKDTGDCRYYLEVLEQGLMKASKSKSIPFEALLSIIKKFERGGCKNEWLHKEKRFRENDLEIILMCQFTTDYFQLVILINQISLKKELINAVLLRVEPGVSIHEGMYKDIIIKKDIVITDKSDSPRIVINKNDVYKGVLNYEIIGDDKVKEILSYKL